MTPIIKTTKSVSVENEQIDVTGEVFTDPVLTTKDKGMKMFTRVEFRNSKGEEVWTTRFFPQQIQELDLIRIVAALADQMVEAFKKTHQ